MLMSNLEVVQHHTRNVSVNFSAALEERKTIKDHKHSEKCIITCIRIPIKAALWK
jgi:hypothetical protein